MRKRCVPGVLGAMQAACLNPVFLYAFLKFSTHPVHCGPDHPQPCARPQCHISRYGVWLERSLAGMMRCPKYWGCGYSAASAGTTLRVADNPSEVLHGFKDFLVANARLRMAATPPSRKPWNTALTDEARLLEGKNVRLYVANRIFVDANDIVQAPAVNDDSLTLNLPIHTGPTPCSATASRRSKPSTLICGP